MCMGGMLMGAVSGLALGRCPYRMPTCMRFGNDTGFVMVGIPGMLATAISIACLSVQAHTAGLFGKRLLWFAFVVSVVLLASFAFLPIAALLVWLIVVAVRSAAGASRPARSWRSARSPWWEWGCKRSMRIL